MHLQMKTYLQNLVNCNTQINQRKKQIKNIDREKNVLCKLASKQSQQINFILYTFKQQQKKSMCFISSFIFSVDQSEKTRTNHIETVFYSPNVQ